MSISARRLQRANTTLTYGSRIGLAVSSAVGATPSYAQAMTQVGNRILTKRIYLQQETIASIQSDIEGYLTTSPSILPVVSVKWTTQSQFSTFQDQLAAFNVPARFVMIVNHEPYCDVSPSEYIQKYTWLMDAISFGTNNQKVVPGTIFNGWAYLPRGVDPNNKLDNVYGDGTPGSGITAFYPLSIVNRLNTMGGIMGADFYDGGTYPTPGVSPLVSMINYYNFWTGTPYVDNLGLTIQPSSVQIYKHGAGEEGSFDASNADTGMKALNDLGFVYGCWWDHDSEHMLLAPSATANSPDAPAMRNSYISAYNDSISKTTLKPV